MKTSQKIIFFLALILISVEAFSDVFPEKPRPPRLVNDYTGFLTEGEKDDLEQKLDTFNRATSTQIAVVILGDLHGYDISDYAVQLARKWGIGQKGKNNGILVLIKPKTSASKGEVFIATGYGLEGAVPDAIAKRIVENEMLPSFRNGNNYEGINKAVTVLMALTRGEYTADEYSRRTKSQGTGGIPVFIIFILFFVVFSFIGRARRARQYSMGHNIPFWLALMMLSGSRNTHGGSFGNFSSGGGSFGGFGGFGGGSFGGGGAGGSW